MKIKYVDFLKAMNRVTSVATKEKNQVNMMFQVQQGDESKLIMAFCTGRTNIFVKAPVELEENDVTEPMVVSYLRVKEICDMFAPSGMMFTSPVEIKQTTKDGQAVPNSLTFRASKYRMTESMKSSASKDKAVQQASDLAEAAEGVEGEAADQLKAMAEVKQAEAVANAVDTDENAELVGTFEQDIRWDDPNSSMKLAIYTRYQMSDALITEDEPDEDGNIPASAEQVDVWAAGDLKYYLDKLTPDKTRQVLFTPKASAGWVYNPTYAMLARVENQFKNPIVLDATMHAEIRDLMAKVDSSEDIRVIFNRDKHTLRLSNSDDTIVMSITVPDPAKNQVIAIPQFRDKKYADVQCTVYFDVFKDIIHNITRTVGGKGDASVMAVIQETDSGTALVFDKVKNAGGNTANKFVLNIQRVRCAQDNIDGMTIKFPLLAVNAIISKLNCDYAAIDVDVSGGHKTIRIGEALVEKQQEAINKFVEDYKANNMLGEDTEVNVSEIITNEDMMNMRFDALSLVGYIQTTE